MQRQTLLNFDAVVLNYKFEHDTTSGPKALCLYNALAWMAKGSPKLIDGCCTFVSPFKASKCKAHTEALEALTAYDSILN